MTGNDKILPSIPADDSKPDLEMIRNWFMADQAREYEVKALLNDQLAWEAYCLARYKDIYKLREETYRKLKDTNKLGNARANQLTMHQTYYEWLMEFYFEEGGHKVSVVKARRSPKSSTVQNKELVLEIHESSKAKAFHSEEARYIHIAEEFKRRRAEWNRENDRKNSEQREKSRQKTISEDRIKVYLKDIQSKNTGGK